MIFEKLPGGKIPENVFRKEEHMPLIWLLVGILIGLLVSRFIFKDKPIGSLRVDQSDPDSDPYLFLELYPGLPYGLPTCGVLSGTLILHFSILSS